MVMSGNLEIITRKYDQLFSTKFSPSFAKATEWQVEAEIKNE